MQVFRPQDAADLKSLLLSEAGASGNFGGRCVAVLRCPCVIPRSSVRPTSYGLCTYSLEDTQYGVGALILLGAKDELQMKPLCSLAAAKLSCAEATVTEAWQAADVEHSCRCVWRMLARLNGNAPQGQYAQHDLPCEHVLQMLGWQSEGQGGEDCKVRSRDRGR